MPNTKATGVAFADPDFDSLSIKGTAVTATSAQLNQASILGATLATINTYSASLTPAAVAANTTAEQLFAVAGVPAGGVVVVNKPTAQAGLGIVGYRISSAGNVGITFGNNTGVSITPTAAETYLFSVIK